jgi:hypothetical protein
MSGVPNSQTSVLRKVVAHLGSALGQSDDTDDRIIIGHLRSAHDLALNVLRAGEASRSSPSIVPTGNEESVYLNEDCLGALTDLETVITNLMAGEYRDPRRVIAFNTAERRSEDVSQDIAREIQRRADLTFNDVPTVLQDFVDRLAGTEKQLALRLV